MSLQYHPDRNKEEGANEKFIEIAEAYEVLSDPDSKWEYDNLGRDSISGAAGWTQYLGYERTNAMLHDSLNLCRRC